MKETFQKATQGDNHDNRKNIKQPDDIAIQTAAWKWVRSFNWMPREIVAKLIRAGDSIIEITPKTEDAPAEDSEDDILPDLLPMWGTMFSFSHPDDNLWLDDPRNLQAMAECGIRIYKQTDYGYIFGIDGMGYDYYKAHWIPLYRARGLRWHSS